MTDTLKSSAITDHPFIAPPGEPWERCVHQVRSGGEHPQRRPCGLAQSAHRETLAPYAPDTPKADGQ